MKSCVGLSAQRLHTEDAGMNGHTIHSLDILAMNGPGQLANGWNGETR